MCGRSFVTNSLIDKQIVCYTDSLVAVKVICDYLHIIQKLFKSVLTCTGFTLLTSLQCEYSDMNILGYFKIASAPKWLYVKASIVHTRYGLYFSAIVETSPSPYAYIIHIYVDLIITWIYRNTKTFTIHSFFPKAIAIKI